MAHQMKNSWWMKPFNFLYKHFDIMVVIQRDTPDVKWGLSLFKVRREE